MPKRTRIVTENKTHFITFTVNDFLPIFSNPSIAKHFVKVIKYYEKRNDYKLHAYVVMPEHVHLLFERLNNRQFSDIVRDIKKYFSFIYKTKLSKTLKLDLSHFYKNGKFKLWQTGYDEVTISSQKQYFVKLNYILNNPVKRGLVEKLISYEFCFADLLIDNIMGESEDSPITSV